MISQVEPFQQLKTSLLTYTDEAVDLDRVKQRKTNRQWNEHPWPGSESVESLNQFLSVKQLFSILNVTVYYRPSEMRLLYFLTVGFFIYLFFFQSPSRLDLTADCHNQYQYRKVVEVAVIWNMIRLKILPTWGVSPQNVPPNWAEKWPPGRQNSSHSNSNQLFGKLKAGLKCTIFQVHCIKILC